MSIETVYTEPNRARDAPGRRVVDVTDLRAEQVESFADERWVHLERRGARTYLVADP